VVGVLLFSRRGLRRLRPASITSVGYGLKL
jgi:hypothetical protein